MRDLDYDTCHARAGDVIDLAGNQLYVNCYFCMPSAMNPQVLIDWYGRREWISHRDRRRLNHACTANQPQTGADRKNITGAN